MVKINNKNKKIIVLIGIIAFLLVIVGASFAYFSINAKSDKENDKTNFITMHGLDYCINECEKLTNESIKILDSLSVDTEALKFLTKKLLDREN